jgi:hypothetical protein
MPCCASIWKLKNGRRCKPKLARAGMWAPGLLNMKPPVKPNERAEPHRDGWTIDIHATALFITAWALILILFALLFRGPREAKWPLVQGTVRDTRIVADHGVETKWGEELTWRADYQVAYSVANHEYAVWADSGIRGESEAGVRLALPRSHPSCRVRYDSKRPEASIAECR